jgi:hypothetical protein
LATSSLREGCKQNCVPKTDLSSGLVRNSARIKTLEGVAKYTLCGRELHSATMMQHNWLYGVIRAGEKDLGGEERGLGCSSSVRLHQLWTRSDLAWERGHRSLC